MSINNVTISGNLTRDAELRRTAGGVAVLSFCVAVNDRRKDQNGEWADYPNFIDCTLFGKRAEALSSILKKGLKLCVSGRLHYSSWETETGKRSKVDVTVEEVEFMSAQKPQQEAYGGEVPF